MLPTAAAQPQQAAEGEAPPGTRRSYGLLRFLPHVAVLVCVGIVYLSVEFYSFSGPRGPAGVDGSYHMFSSSDGALVLSTEGVRDQKVAAAVEARAAAAEREAWLERHADELGCDFPFQRVNPDCPRFVHLPVTRGGGLGNKYFTYILGMLLAMDMKGEAVGCLSRP
jgi:hypothetical protein